MTVDKPPLALWVQALSVRVFGFNSWAMLVPQALMGVAAVALVYDLTRAARSAARAGSSAGAVLALTPISVAVARHNNPDTLLVLCVRRRAVGADPWPARTGESAGSSLAGAGVGLGFEAKMGAALLVVPAIDGGVAVARRAAQPLCARLLAGGAALVVVGGAWPLLMALTPAVVAPVDLGHVATTASGR